MNFGASQLNSSVRPTEREGPRAAPVVPMTRQGDNHGMHTFTLEYWQDEKGGLSDG